MQVKPHITLLYLLSVFTILLLISFAFFIVLPENQTQFRLVSDIYIGFPSPAEIFRQKKDHYADISQIIEQNQITSDNDSVADAPAAIFIPDTLRANADSLKNSVRRLQYPGTDRSLLYPVFREMDSAASLNKVVRIVHYGDSQIEGDRITSFLRNKLQKKFGGKGVGLIPARQVYDFKFSVFHNASENWNRYTLYGKTDTLIKHKRYGLLASFNSFTPQPCDSSPKNRIPEYAWISVQQSPYSYGNTKSFEQCRVFYGYNKQPFTANLIVGGQLADSGTYQPADRLKQIKWSFDSPVSEIKIELKGKHSPELYCIALDGENGVAVDNVAMRGCAGTVFTKMDPGLFSSLVEKLDVKLMILQFGGNIVPNIRSNYSFYERWFYSQLNYIRTYAPQVQIIVIGVSDMSVKKGDTYTTYPNLELVRDALKNATFRANAIYWDMYEAMGGKNSMPSWVFAKPPLASPDFVHFNPKGAQIIANMFYNALMHEYNQYKKHLLLQTEE
ncbi:MAG: hypothetical protein JXB34_01310 [Bacteroidales bacterium]|nr:hypothetical protein [Bacteroidales bacterium]